MSSGTTATPEGAPAPPRAGIVNPPGVRRVSGYSHAKLRRGVPVFVTGQVAWDVEGRVVGKGDIAAQLEMVWMNVHAILDDLGATADDVVKLTTYATDTASLPAIGQAKARQFDPGSMPASTLLVVAALADPDLLVEIEVVVMISADHPRLS